MSYHERHLPHWQPEGAALFVTWRLYGSLPASVQTLKGASAGQRFVAFDRELDRAATGPVWLADRRIAQCVAEALHYGERELHLYRLRAWVLMSNHMHILIYPNADLSRITKAIKSFSARKANTILNRTGQAFWQDESYDHWVRTPEELEKIVRYIETNPVTAELVSRAEDWLWSSAFGDRPGGLSYI
ncbi:MAG: transposase [Bryobacteraceae bacterium]|jgi:REP element-mobilizing transposase RayT